MAHNGLNHTHVTEIEEESDNGFLSNSHMDKKESSIKRETEASKQGKKRLSRIPCSQTEPQHRRGLSLCLESVLVSDQDDGSEIEVVGDGGGRNGLGEDDGSGIEVAGDMDLKSKSPAAWIWNRSQRRRGKMTDLIVSNDESFLLGVACAELVENLRLVAKSVSRVASTRCSDEANHRSASSYSLFQWAAAVRRKGGGGGLVGMVGSGLFVRNAISKFSASVDESLHASYRGGSPSLGTPKAGRSTSRFGRDDRSLRKSRFVEAGADLSRFGS
ncbi:hypothetical protein LINPERPRIM_LOCUS25330 [Linum perenne]